MSLLPSPNDIAHGFTNAHLERKTANNLLSLHPPPFRVSHFDSGIFDFDGPPYRAVGTGNLVHHHVLELPIKVNDYYCAKHKPHNGSCRYSFSATP